MDGSQKLPQRLLSVIRQRLSAGEAFETAALAVAAWMRYAGGRDEQGQAIDVRDPLAGRLAGLAADTQGKPEAMVASYLGVEEVFGADLPQSDAFRNAVGKARGALSAEGPENRLEGIAAS